MKDIVFTRQDGILVRYKATLINSGNILEQFTIADIKDKNTYLEQNLFHFLDKKVWSLVEMIFFAINNNMCLTIYDNQSNVIQRYGVCASISQTILREQGDPILQEDGSFIIAE